jgi:hypothetical protein
MTYPQPLQNPPPKHHGVRNGCLLGTGIVALAIIAIGATAAALSGGSTPRHPAATATSTGPAAPVYASPVQDTPVQDRYVTRVLFKVTGTASSGADITYGSDSDNLSPHSGLSTALPWTGSLRYNENALYYDVTAQLQGGGDIRCYVILKVTDYYSDGTHRSKSKVEARGHASGGYNICDAQVSND